MAATFIPIMSLPVLPGSPGVDMWLPIQAGGITYRVDARKFPLGADALATWINQQANLPFSREIAAGPGMAIDLSDPSKIILSSFLSGGIVVNILGGAGIDVNSTNPANPIVSLSPSALAGIALAATSIQSIAGVVNQIDIDVTSPTNPIASLAAPVLAALALAGTALQQGSISAGQGIVVDNTNPAFPVVALNAATIAAISNAVQSVVGTANQIDVNSAVPASPVLTLAAPVMSALALAGAALQPGSIVAGQGILVNNTTPAAPSISVNQAFSFTWTGLHTFLNSGSGLTGFVFPAGTSVNFTSDAGANNSFALMPATNRAAIYTAGSQRLIVSDVGGVTINAPSTSVALTVNSAAGNVTLLLQGPANSAQLRWTDGVIDAYAGCGSFLPASWNFGTGSNHGSAWFTNGAQRVAVGAAGGVTINGVPGVESLRIVGDSGVGSLVITRTPTETFKIYQGNGDGITYLDASTSLAFNAAGGTRLMYSGGFWAVSSAVDNVLELRAPASPYISFFSNTAPLTRRGYIQAHSGGLQIQSEHGSLVLAAGSGPIELGLAGITAQVKVYGDVHATRADGASGVYYFGNVDNRYLYYDGTNYRMPGAVLFGFTPLANAAGEEYVTAQWVRANGGGGSQTWVDATASRALDAVYTNTLGYPYSISVNFAFTAAIGATIQVKINGVVVVTTSNGNSLAIGRNVYCMIPIGATYQVLQVTATSSLVSWFESRQ